MHDAKRHAPCGFGSPLARRLLVRGALDRTSVTLERGANAFIERGLFADFVTLADARTHPLGVKRYRTYSGGFIDDDHMPIDVNQSVVGQLERGRARVARIHVDRDGLPSANMSENIGDDAPIDEDFPASDKLSRSPP